MPPYLKRVATFSGVARGTWVHAPPPRRSWKLAFFSGLPGLCPWTPLGDFRPQTPCVVPP